MYEFPNVALLNALQMQNLIPTNSSVVCVVPGPWHLLPCLYKVVKTHRHRHCEVAGDAVAAHMEDFYVEGLTNCMEESCEDDDEVMGCSKRAKACVARSRDKSSAPVPQKAS